MPHEHPHAPDLAQTMPLGLLARVGVAVEVQLRSNDNSTCRHNAFLGVALSVLESHGCLYGHARILGDVYFTFYWIL